MAGEAIERDILIDAPPEVVWGVVTEPEEIVHWFAERAEIDMRPGGAGKLSWDRYGDVGITVERIEPPHLFSYRWVAPDGEQPTSGNSVLVEFTLTPEGDGTRLRVVESGLDELGWSEERRRTYAADHNEGWEKHLTRLRDHLVASAR
jgi:uncharacterized protein YndB with AHSA1/START domain